MSANVNFVRQQGFDEASAATCAYQFPALMVQPRIIGVLVVLGIVLESWPHFLILAILLWWNAAVPTRNPFDWLSNVLVERPKGMPPIGPAPAPRRFAQAMAGAFTLGIAGAIATGRWGVAWVLEGVLVAALAALLFGKYCLGSYVFHVLQGRSALANRTLPWSRGDETPEERHVVRRNDAYQVQNRGSATRLPFP